MDARRTNLSLAIAIVMSATAALSHELESPGVIFADEDGHFEGDLLFRAGAQGAIPLHLEMFFGPNAGDYGVAAEILCTAHLEAGEEERFPFSGNLTNPASPGNIDAFFSTNCPGDPEPGILATHVTILPSGSGPCQPSPEALCLRDGRFRVEVSWEGFEARTGAGKAMPLVGVEDSGLFWFFQSGNLELLVKVLDGCSLNGHYWVFLASASNVAYEVRVTDLWTKDTRTYRKPLGEIPALVPDTSAFDSCF